MERWRTLLPVSLCLTFRCRITAVVQGWEGRVQRCREQGLTLFRSPGVAYDSAYKRLFIIQDSGKVPLAGEPLENCIRTCDCHCGSFGGPL
jgi:hypothetical protein